MTYSPSQQGFTLIEILVVIFILGISAMILVPNIGNQDQVIAKEEAKRFLKVMKLAQERALFQGIELGLKVEPERYLFMQYQAGKWQEIEGNTFAARKRPPAVKYALSVEGDLTLQTLTPQKDKKIETPQILILSSGEMTPFVMAFVTNTQEDPYRVEAGITAELSLWRKDEKLSGPSR